MPEITIHPYDPGPARARRAAALRIKRKARYFNRPDPSDTAATEAWSQTQIASGVKPREIVEWLWESGQRICALCREPVDIDLRHPHPAAAQHDHIIPRGLTRPAVLHTWGNVRVTHAVCNQSRGAGHEQSVEQYVAAKERGILAYKTGTPVQYLYEHMRISQRLGAGAEGAIEGLELLLRDSACPSWNDWPSREAVEEALARHRRARDWGIYVTESYEAQLEELRAEVAARERDFSEGSGSERPTGVHRVRGRP